MKKKYNLLRFLTLVFALSGCGYLRIDPMHVLLRSDVITSPQQEQEILSRAKLTWTTDNRVRVLEVSGTPYERGYQHGALLSAEVQDNLEYMHSQALKIYRSRELFEEAYERLRPFIPAEYIEEMHGLAHGAKVPLELIHHIHALPSMSEWGGKKRLKKLVKQMIAGELGTSCSNIGSSSDSSADGIPYAVRILDWGLHKVSKLHEYPLITINRGEGDVTAMNIGWVGFLGAVSGMNAEGITLGEMGYKDPESETLRGMPMIFLLREVLRTAKNLGDVRKLLREAPGTNSFTFLMTDGKSGTAEFYVKDPTRFLVFQPGEELKEEHAHFPAIEGISYGGHFDERMYEQLSVYQGKLSPEIFMEKIIPEIAMKSNFQNVIYDAKHLKVWVSNAAGKDKRAAEQPYTFFDLGGWLAEH